MAPPATSESHLHGAPYISEYDRNVRPTWHTEVVKEYGAAKAAKELRARGWKVEIARDQGRVRVMGVRYA